MTRKVTIFIALFVAGLLLLLPMLRSHRKGEAVQSQLVAQAAPSDTSGFARATGPQPLTFPADFGLHPDYQTEWWYYTGNLDSTDGHHFGYQLTFFRRALLPPNQVEARASDWATRQVYMAHFALTDVSPKNYQAFERLARGAAGLAGAQAVPYHVWLEDWQVVEVSPGVYRLQATQDNLSLDLQLKDLKGPILQGDQGYSQKGPEPRQASYYYSQTRLESSGMVKTNEGTYPVSGLSWMDHEFSTSALGPNQVGWDWFALQLSNSSEIMLFQLRHADGSLDPFSSGTYVAPDGSTRQLKREDFQVQVNTTWKSPHTQAVYPASWTITIPWLDLHLEIEPYLADQELNVSYAYWEGAVRAKGQQAGQAITGNGYIEMTGYSASMGGKF